MLNLTTARLTGDFDHDPPGVRHDVLGSPGGEVKDDVLVKLGLIRRQDDRKDDGARPLHTLRLSGNQTDTAR